VLPNLSLLWVIAFVLFLTVVLDRLLFRPISRVMAERERRVASARQLAEESAARAAAANAEVDEKIAAARTEVYRQMDEMRRAALDERAALIARTREEAAAAVAEAAARVQAEVAVARAQLARDADALGRAAADRILGQKAS
jgi:F-type H+-transporting ATPase subunit b